MPNRRLLVLTGPFIAHGPELVRALGKVGAELRVHAGETEAALVAGYAANKDWATQVVVSAGALAPTAYVLRQALVLGGQPFGEVFVEGLADSSLHAERSVLRERAVVQRRGPAPLAYVEVAERLLGAQVVRMPERKTVKEIGSARAKITDAPRPNAKIAKTIGRAKPRAVEAVPDASSGHAHASGGVTTSAVRQQIAQRLRGDVTPNALAAWARERWLQVERGPAIADRALLADALQALALSATPGAQLTDTELLAWMAKLG